MASFSEKFKNLKVRHQVIFSLVIFFGVINVWRGAWGLLNLYIFPHMEIFSLWFSLILGLIILFSTHYISRELM